MFAYGQTNSGKTHTMRGSPTEPGIIPLAVNNLFDAIHQVFLELLYCYPWLRLGYTKSILLLQFLLLFWYLHLEVWTCGACLIFKWKTWKMGFTLFGLLKRNSKRYAVIAGCRYV